MGPVLQVGFWLPTCAYVFEHITTQCGPRHNPSTATLGLTRNIYTSPGIDLARDIQTPEVQGDIVPMDENQVFANA